MNVGMAAVRRGLSSMPRRRAPDRGHTTEATL